MCWLWTDGERERRGTRRKQPALSEVSQQLDPARQTVNKAVSFTPTVTKPERQSSEDRSGRGTGVELQDLWGSFLPVLFQCDSSSWDKQPKCVNTDTQRVQQRRPGHKARRCVRLHPVYKKRCRSFIKRVKCAVLRSSAAYGTSENPLKECCIHPTVLSETDLSMMRGWSCQNLIKCKRRFSL